MGVMSNHTVSMCAAHASFDPLKPVFFHPGGTDSCQDGQREY
jgi:hypothetical protein